MSGRSEDRRTSRGRSVRCPICGTRVALAAALAPFCSERCKTIDLGNWASERYRAAAPEPSSEAEGLPGGSLPESE